MTRWDELTDCQKTFQILHGEPFREDYILIQDDMFKAGSIARTKPNAPHYVTENACNMIDDLGYGPYFVKTRRLQFSAQGGGVKHTRLYDAVRNAENWISETNQHCDVTDKNGADRYSTDKGLIAPGKVML